MIGPQIPAHLIAQRRESEEKEDENENEYDVSIGPQMPGHKSSIPVVVEGADDNGDEDEDEDGPMPLPDISSSINAPISRPSSGPSNTRRQIGPALPQTTFQGYPFNDEDEWDEDEVGPRPLPSGVHTEEDDGVKRFIEVEEKRRKEIEEASKPKPLKREEWMLKPPTASELLGSLDPTRLKAPRQFSRKSGTSSSGGDSSLWTETPAEKQQRLADEVVGKRRRAVDPTPEDDDKKRRKKDEEYIRKGVNDYTARVRGPSLVHQHTTASEKNKEKDEPEVIWDHARDMALGGRLMDDEKRNKFISEARGLGDRFSSAKSGGFL